MYDPEDMEPGSVSQGEHERNAPHFAKTQEENPDFASWHQPHEAHGCASHLYPREELKKDMAVYYGMMSFLDREIGLILDDLDARGLTDDTLIVFTTDYGHFLGQHGLVAKGPFHYEDMLRIPFIVSWPGWAHLPICRAYHSLTFGRGWSRRRAISRSARTDTTPPCHTSQAT